MGTFLGFTLRDVVILFVALSCLGLAVEVGMLHFRGKFRKKVMWAPVTASAISFVWGVVVVFFDTSFTRLIFQVLMLAIFFNGLAGPYFHVQRRIRKQGRLTRKNILWDPPLLAPGAMAALAGLGFVATLFP